MIQFHSEAKLTTLTIVVVVVVVYKTQALLVSVWFWTTLH